MDDSDPEEDFEVVAYSGYQGEQEPRALIIDGTRQEVVAVEDRWYVPGARYFRVRTEGGSHLVRYDLVDFSWSRVLSRATLTPDPSPTGGATARSQPAGRGAPPPAPRHPAVGGAASARSAARKTSSSPLSRGKGAGGRGGPGG